MPTGVPAGFAQSAGNRAFTRTPGRNALVEQRVTDLSRGDGAYLTGARNRGVLGAQRRGQANVTAAANAAEQAGLQAVLPIASQDANTFASAEAQNQDALNAFEAQKVKAETDDAALQAAIINGGGAVYHSQQRDEAERERDREFQREMAREDRSWRTGERLGTQDYGREDREDTQGWQSGESAAERYWRTGERAGTQEYEAGQNALNRSFQGDQAQRDRDYNRWSEQYGAQTAMSMRVADTILSDPSYFRDPAAAQGMMEFWASNFSRMMSQYMPQRTGG